MGSLTQPVIGMPCKKSIDADHCEHRLTADAVDRCFELGCKIIIFACLRKQRPDPFADAYIAPLCCSTNPLSELDGDMYLERFWPCHARTPCGQEPGTHCERRLLSKSETRTCQEHARCAGMRHFWLSSIESDWRIGDNSFLIEKLPFLPESSTTLSLLSFLPPPACDLSRRVCSSVPSLEGRTQCYDLHGIGGFEVPKPGDEDDPVRLPIVLKID